MVKRRRGAAREVRVAAIDHGDGVRAGRQSAGGVGCASPLASSVPEASVVTAVPPFRLSSEHVSVQ
jgi:hypothetical protein